MRRGLDLEKTVISDTVYQISGVGPAFGRPGASSSSKGLPCATSSSLSFAVSRGGLPTVEPACVACRAGAWGRCGEAGRRRLGRAGRVLHGRVGPSAGGGGGSPDA